MRQLEYDHADAVHEWGWDLELMPTLFARGNYFRIDELLLAHETQARKKPDDQTSDLPRNLLYRAAFLSDLGQDQAALDVCKEDLALCNSDDSKSDDLRSLRLLMVQLLAFTEQLDRAAGLFAQVEAGDEGGELAVLTSSHLLLVHAQLAAAKDSGEHALNCIQQMRSQLGDRFLPNHVFHQESYRLEGRIHASMGSHENAANSFAECVKRMRAAFPSNHPRLGCVYQLWSLSLQAIEQTAEADNKAKLAQAIFDEHADLARTSAQRYIKS